MCVSVSCRTKDGPCLSTGFPPSLRPFLWDQFPKPPSFSPPVPLSGSARPGSGPDARALSPTLVTARGEPHVRQGPGHPPRGCLGRERWENGAQFGQKRRGARSPKGQRFNLWAGGARGERRRSKEEEESTAWGPSAPHPSPVASRPSIYGFNSPSSWQLRYPSGRGPVRPSALRSAPAAGAGRVWGPLTRGVSVGPESRWWARASGGGVHVGAVRVGGRRGPLAVVV